MRRNTARHIAWRYLFSRKSHSAVTAITAVSIAGVAVATAALVCVLSVFNGFQGMITDKLDLLSPDMLVTPAEGKTVAEADSMAARLERLPFVELAMPSITENALAICNDRESPVLIKGVDESKYDKITQLRSVIKDGGSYKLSRELPEGQRKLIYDPEFEEYFEDETGKGYFAAVSVGVANRLYMGSTGEKMMLFAPRRKGRINMANPANSFMRDSVEVSAVWQTDQAEYDKNTVVVDIEVARRMLQYTDEATAVEIKLTPGTNPRKAEQEISQFLGKGYDVKDRLHQQEINFRMVQIEKWITYLLLTFILVIASFNLISSLSMLVLEKRESLATLRALGMSKNCVGAVFAWESFYVSLTGAVLGIVLGVVLCLLQENFGLVKLNADAGYLVINAYPVELRATDLLLVMIPVAVIGAVTAWVTMAFAKNRIEKR